MRHFICLATVISFLLAAACDDGDPPNTGKAPAEARETGTAATAPVSSSPTGTFCQLPEPVYPPEYSDVGVNVDGNGDPDRMNIHALPAGAGYASYLQLVVDGRSAISVEIAPASPVVRPIGGYDVNGDGRDELFVITGNGAATTWIDVYEFDPTACSLVRLAAPGDDRPAFLVGASIGGGGGLVCSGGQFVSISFRRESAGEPLRYSGKRTSYAIDGVQLRLVDETSFEPDSAGTNLVATFECGVLTLTGRAVVPGEVVDTTAVPSPTQAP